MRHQFQYASNIDCFCPLAGETKFFFLSRTLREFFLYFKKEINTPCSDILIHRRCAPLSAGSTAATCVSQARKNGNLDTQGCKTVGLKTYSSLSSAFYFQIRRGTLRSEEWTCFHLPKLPVHEDHLTYRIVDSRSACLGFSYHDKSEHRVKQKSSPNTPLIQKDIQPF